MIRISEKWNSDDRKLSSSDHNRQVALLASGKSQRDPISINNKPKTESSQLFSWFQSYLFL